MENVFTAARNFVDRGNSNKIFMELDDCFKSG